LIAMATCAIGLALILVVSDNWQFIPLVLKVSIALMAMLALHTGGYWFRFHSGQVERGNWWFLVASVFSGCGVLMVTEHLHVAEFYPWAFFIWAAGSLPLALVLGSFPLLVLVNAVATVWTVWFAWRTATSVDTGRMYLYFGFFLGSVYWANTNRSRSLL